jgi:hypothetical protein
LQDFVDVEVLEYRVSRVKMRKEKKRRREEAGRIVQERAVI